MLSTFKTVNTGDGQNGLGFVSAVADCLVSGVLVVDHRQRLARANPEARRILGLDTEPAADVTVDLLPAPLPAVLRDLLASGRSLSGRQLDLSRPGGSVVRLRLSAVAAPPGLVVVLNDLSAALRLEENLWRLDRLAGIGTLSASMAHEIKNALVAGKTFVGLLLEQHQDSELVEIVRRELGRIDSIVSRVLKFVGAARPAFAAVHLHDCLDHSLRLVQPQLESKALELVRRFQAAPDLVNGDDCELQQAFVNLFFNALEAMGPHGTLTVATEMVPPETSLATLREPAEPTHLRVIVRDTGIGIAPENLPRLFEPFFTTIPTGTGLGLPITQRIIQEHRGVITVASEPGQGAAFTIVLPLLKTA